MNFEINFSPRAEETFEAIANQLLQKWGNKFVNKFSDKVSKSLDIISKNPFIYPISIENAGLRKCILHKNCSMLYSINIDHVEIMYFWDNRQDPLVTY